MSIYKTFMGGREVTAALSFLSTKEMDKRYSQFLQKITVGYECEISSTGTENDLDEDSLRNEFDSEFDYPQDRYLYRLSNNHKIPQVLEMFGIEAIYGMPDLNDIKEIGNLIKPLYTSGYRVVGLPMQDGSYILEEPNINEYRGYSRSNAETFSTRDDGRLINLNLAITKAEEALQIIKQIQEAYPVELAMHQATDAAATAYLLIQNCIMHLKTKEAQTNEIYAKKNIYFIGEHIHKYVKAWRELLNIMNINTGQSTNFLVFNQEKHLVLLQSTKYDEAGLGSPLLKWSENGKEIFEEEYQEAYTEEREAQWESHLNSAREDDEDDDTNSAEAIHRLVVKYVDPKAKVSLGYHAAVNQKYKGKFTVVEPDSSIKPMGAEVVSPVFTGLAGSLVWLNKVFDMIDDADLETNASTGLHVNIGTFTHISKKITEDHEESRPIIDVLKLAVLSGDHYLLDQFGRFGNTYAKSLASNIKELAQANFDFNSSSKTDLWKTIVDLNRAFVRGQSYGDDSRYRTVNMQHLLDNGYLEFRIAGGANYHADKEKVKKAIYRYVHLCAIACDPQAHFKDYMVELYKRFVDGTGPSDPKISNKEPRPKNVQEAMYYLRQWSSNQYTQGKEGLNREALKHLQNIVTNNNAENPDYVESHIVLDLISGMNAEHYKNVNNNVLYSIRLLMLFVVRNQPNPKLYLSDIYNKHKKSIEDYIAPKLYKNKPQWVRYFFTGTMTDRQITSSTGFFRRRHIQKTLTAQHLPENPYRFSPFAPYGYWITDEGKFIEVKRAHAVTVEKYIKATPDLPNTSELDFKDSSSLVQYGLFNLNWIRVVFTPAASGKTCGIEIGKNSVSRGALQSLIRIVEEQHFRLYHLDISSPTNSETKDYDTDTIDDLIKTARRNIKPKVIKAMNLESADYTNKSKSVKVIYYANRSTPQVVKPNQTVKAKEGYGKRIKIRNATPEEIEQFKKGKWLRTRSDGKKPGDKGSMKSKYRPQLAKKSREADKRKKMSASESNYLQFIASQKGS